MLLATGACGRLGLPASGYLYGTYANPTNAGDGYPMAYHAGAEPTGMECFRINPLNPGNRRCVTPSPPP
ncbi:hypothetical protein OQI_33285 [Streptomyces pharetrae CZA14]|uniref:Uncharacterized protein n=1 Tax=Streptomyces pharetrae CZA14 TaxID=1144883 RepID=A0ABX3YBS9_9ACTN|nr:hypothetical protein OQI_33285 [Streptomyces pharetrae CZA14]